MSDLLSLPPEVWICIFHHATHVPGTLVPEIYAYAGLVGPVYNRTFHPRLQVALITKCALVRVCKQWWHLATPCLYQSVYISRARCLKALSRTLMDSAADNDAIVGMRHLGEYTQRLDVAIHGKVAESGLLATIINCMPNIAIVSFATQASYTVSKGLQNNIIDSLCCLAPSLRVLDLSWALSSRPPASQITNLLTKCTHLRVLNCPRLIWSKDFDHGGIPPTVTTLRVQGILQPLDFDPLLPFDHKHRRHPGPTALQELILNLDQHHSHWEDLLHAYGSQLTSAEFYIPKYLLLNVEGYMNLVAQTCPSLRRLTITSGHFSSFIRPNLIFPSITYLGLRASQSQLTRNDFKTLFAFLEELKSSVPSLRVVRLLNELNLRCLFSAHTKLAVRALQPFIEATPFRVEDEEGILLTDRLRALGHL